MKYNIAYSLRGVSKYQFSCISSGTLISSGGLVSGYYFLSPYEDSNNWSKARINQAAREGSFHVHVYREYAGFEFLKSSQWNCISNTKWEF